MPDLNYMKPAFSNTGLSILCITNLPIGIFSNFVIILTRSLALEDSKAAVRDVTDCINTRQMYCRHLACKENACNVQMRS